MKTGIGEGEGAEEGEEIPLRGGAIRSEEDQEREGPTPGSRGVVFDSGDGNEEEGADERTLVDEQEQDRGGGDQERLMRDLENSEFATDNPRPIACQHRQGADSEGEGSGGGGGNIGEKAGIILVRSPFFLRFLSIIMLTWL